MNRTPNLEILKPATEFAENIAKQIDVEAYMNQGMGVDEAINHVWNHIAENLFENMDIPLSASGTIDDILEQLAPQRRRMKVTKDNGSCRIEYKSGSDIVYIRSTNEGELTMSFQPNCSKTQQIKQAEAFFDISHYGPDSTAAVIAALLRTYKILSERFKRYAYR